MSEFRTVRRVQAFNRLLQVVLFITLVAGLNYWAAHRHARFDATADGRYRLAAETRAYLAALQQPVRVIIVRPTQTEDDETLERVYRQVGQLLREVVHAARREGEAMVEVEYVESLRDKARMNELQRDYGIDSERAAIVVGGQRHRLVDLDKTFDEELKRFRGEEIFMAAILDIGSTETDRVYFLTGHGEVELGGTDQSRGISALRELLRQRNYELASLDLLGQPGVPPDADLVAVVSPLNAISEENLLKLRRYLDEDGGRLILLLEPGREHGYDPLLRDWGLRTPDHVVIELDGERRLQDGGLLIRPDRMASHPITEFARANELIVATSVTRPILIREDSQRDDSLFITPLLRSTEPPGSYAESAYRAAGTIRFDAASDILGPLPILALAERRTGTDLGVNLQGGRLVVGGTSSFLEDEYIQYQGNQVLARNLFDWMLNRDDVLNVPPKPVSQYQLSLSDDERQRLLAWFLSLPGAVLLLGVLVFIVRRN